MKGMEIHIIMGEKHTLQILDVLDNLDVNWIEIEDRYVSALENGAKNIFTGNPLTVEEAADDLWVELHRIAEQMWLRSITREQAEIMEATLGQTFFGRIVVCRGLDFLAHNLTQEWDRANRKEEEQ